MPHRPHHPSGSASDSPVADEAAVIDLAVRGTMPAGLAGRYVCIGAGTVDVVRLTDGDAPSFSRRASPAGTTTLTSFAGSVLAFGDETPAYELGLDLDTVRGVDLAGARRSLTARPAVDPNTGELHLLTFASDPAQLHVSVSPGGLTRTIRSIDNAPSRIRQLELTPDDVVLLADGFVGVTGRAGVRADATWFAVDTHARGLAAADAGAEIVVVYTTGPSLVRWTLPRRSTTAAGVFDAPVIDAEVIDATPQAFVGRNDRPPGATRRFLWTVGAGAVHEHDLRAGTRRSHDFGDGRRPGALVFVADPGRRGAEDGGWLVGFVHDERTPATEFVVLDAQAIEQPALAVARIPHRLPGDAYGAWIAAAQI